MSSGGEKKNIKLIPVFRSSRTCGPHYSLLDKQKFFSFAYNSLLPALSANTNYRDFQEYLLKKG